ncbi:MAG TPA: protein translocase subunit SecF, partial [Candidatus Eisenbacteria bacterium]|nr:protein translocase subunit SecF [Candidatus Eisenbacteria bacterium]
MQFFGETHLNFVGTRRTAFVVSAVLIIAGLVSLAVRGGPDLSIDFEGGTLVQVRFDEPVEIGRLRAVVDEAGYSGGQIQVFGDPNEYLIKVEKVDESGIASEKLLDALE